ncbi:hypothetical protein [Carbonactinospora thermoautotrophica]|uniref:hypothetical protein n=1 Tax=Carbonactinospora thermoautotrophica TaxID=1469144 RepID=UPI003DA8EE81
MIAPIVGLIGGLLIAASAESARGTDLRAGRLTELSELIREASQRNQQLERRVVDLGRQVEALSEDRARHDEQVSRAHHDVDRLGRGTTSRCPGRTMTWTASRARPGSCRSAGPRSP